MSESITDVEELAKIAYDGWCNGDDLHDIALAVRDAVCPPDHVVVKRADIEAMLAAVGRINEPLGSARATRMIISAPAYTAIRKAADSQRATLGTEATEPENDRETTVRSR